MTSVARGHCLCRAVRYEFTGKAKWQAHCHCESCRRNTSSPFTSWLGVSKAEFRFTGHTPEVYRSSAGARRSFCVACGTPMAYENDRWPDEIHLYAASLEHPQDFTPQAHVFWAEKVPWVHITDDLPKYRAMMGGDATPSQKT